MMEITKNLKKLNILYVEDDKEVNEIFTFIFKKYAKYIYNAFNGKEGLELFKNNHIDIVISDIQMPKMNGIEMAKEIRKIDENIPIVFITAFGEENEYLKEAIKIGVDAYITKPIEKEKILKELNKIADNLVLKEELKNYTKLIKIVFDYQTDGLLLFDKDYNILLHNKALKDFINTDNKDDLDFIKSKISLILENDKNHKKDNNKKDNIISLLYKDKFFDLKIRKIDNFILVVFIDMSYIRKEINKIEDLSLKDELTGAYNRKKIDKIKDDLINKKICLIMCDIDNFKKINDTYGHLKGDEVLKVLSKNIQNNLRSNDLFIRWGGEEFIILFQSSNIVNANKIAGKLRNIVNSINIKDVGHFSCSFGVACGIIEKDGDLDKILKKSDDALYLAKNNGKNRVEIYSE
jgi:two-component system cell cycle response regulator